jgi:hypothetical protein
MMMRMSIHYDGPKEDDVNVRDYKIEIRLAIV